MDMFVVPFVWIDIDERFWGGKVRSNSFYYFYVDDAGLHGGEVVGTIVIHQ